jgi:DNA/RNA endonuclease YhcR with UshA esterase domain
MRKLLLGLFALCAMNSAMAQTDTTISGIQFRTPEQLATGADENNFANLTPASLRNIKVKGVVLIPGTANVSSSESNPNRHVWMRQIGGGPFSTIGFRQSGNTSPTDMRDLQVGDTVEVTGTAAEFQGESQIGPVSAVRVVSLYEPGSPKPQATQIPSIGIFNNATQQNNIVTGEQYEGDYIELRNVRVVAVDRFFGSNASRVSFTIQDANGNRMNVGDRFFAQRLPNCSTSPVNLCGRFVPPSVGDEYRAIRGIVLHSKNVRGYEIHPFDSADYEKGKSAPFVINVNNNPIKPTSAQNCLITAQITDGTDSLGRRAEITSAMLFYTRVVSTTTSITTFTDSLPLIRLGASDLFNATIPAQPDGSIVAYYIRVRNNQGLTTNSPDVTRPAADFPDSPRFYWVFDRALRIADIQTNPITPSRQDITNTVSGSIGAQVTVSGIVTVDTSFSGRAFFMQDATGRDFSGIMVRVADESDLRNLRKGQTVTVSGTVLEDAQMTYILASSVVIENQPLTAILPLEIPLTELNVGDSTANGATNWSLAKEKYEGQLVRIINLSGNLVVSRVNYLSRVGTRVGTNFGEWKVSLDSTDVNGVVILSGFRSSVANTFVSSRYNPYVNSVDTSNRLRVTPNIVRRAQEFAAITGVVYHSFGILKIIPRDGSDLWLTPQSANGLINNLVAMFPNPATESVNINLNLENVSGYNVQFNDLSGRTVKRNALNSVNNTISVANLNNGLYVVSVTDASGKLVFRNKLNIVK